MTRQLAMLPEIMWLRRYLQSQQAASDPAQQREARVRALFDRFASAAVSPDVPAAAVQLFVDHFVSHSADQVAD